MICGQVYVPLTWNLFILEETLMTLVWPASSLFLDSYPLGILLPGKKFDPLCCLSKIQRGKRTKHKITKAVLSPRDPKEKREVWEGEDSPGRCVCTRLGCKIETSLQTLPKTDFRGSFHWLFQINRHKFSGAHSDKVVVSILDM